MFYIYTIVGILDTNSVMVNTHYIYINFYFLNIIALQTARRDFNREAYSSLLLLEENVLIITLIIIILFLHCH